DRPGGWTSCCSSPPTPVRVARVGRGTSTSRRSGSAVVVEPPFGRLPPCGRISTAVAAATGLAPGSDAPTCAVDSYRKARMSPTPAQVSDGGLDPLDPAAVDSAV